MIEDVFGYLLQVLTIVATIVLGLYTAIQSKKLQKGQNVVSVTTNFRLHRSEQIKQACAILLSNSAPELLGISEENAYNMLQKSIEASSQLSSILHRSFDKDMELILLSEGINQLISEYIKSKYTCEENGLAETTKQLIGYRRIFTIKCDMYTYAEWNRIKKETSGVDTMSEEWFRFYEELSNKYQEELEGVYREYGLVEV